MIAIILRYVFNISVNCMYAYVQVMYICDAQVKYIDVYSYAKLPLEDNPIEWNQYECNGVNMT